MNGLTRSVKNRQLSGVIGGICEQQKWDVNIARVLFVLITIFFAGFPGVIAYIIAAVVIPEAPEAPEVIEYFNEEK